LGETENRSITGCELYVEAACVLCAFPESIRRILLLASIDFEVPFSRSARAVHLFIFYVSLHPISIFISKHDKLPPSEFSKVSRFAGLPEIFTSHRTYGQSDQAMFKQIAFVWREILPKIESISIYRDEGDFILSDTETSPAIVSCNFFYKQTLVIIFL